MEISPVNIRKFELEVKLRDGSKHEYDYKRRKEHVSAKVKIRDKDGTRSTQKDQAGIEAIEKLLAEVGPSPQMTEAELLSRARNALHVSDDAIDHMEVEVEFADGTEIEAETRH